MSGTAVVALALAIAAMLLAAVGVVLGVRRRPVRA
jgi:hypothetical protein